MTQAGIHAVHRETAPWKRTSGDWFTGAEELRAAAARLMGADADGVALTTSVSYGVAVAAANIPIESGQNVVVLGEQFPSNLYAWRERCVDRGASLRAVRKQPADAWTDVVVSAIDDDTALVAVPNCHWTDGSLLDLERTGEAARAVGAAFVIDASQSLGAHPIDVSALQPDFLLSVGHKWQLGPYGIGYLYAAPKWRETGRPLEASWLTRAGAEDFAALVDYTDDYRPGARRFDVGGYPQFVLLPMAVAATEQLLEWGVANIRDSLRPLTDRIAAGAEELGCSVLSRERRVAHMVGLRPTGVVPADLHARLVARGVYVSIRGASIRVSPHLYNDPDDIDRFLGVLGECLAEARS